MTEQLLYITQVAGYQNGPAGVHRVLPQATVAMAQLVGARFNGHPWTTEFTIEVADQHHPATAHLDERFRWEDEIYQFRDLRSDARILLQMRQGDVDPTAARSASDTRLLLAWCFEEGRGRIFYTALGHFPIAYEYPTYQRYLSGELSWVLGHDR